MEKAVPFYKGVSKLIQSTVRYRLLALVLCPILGVLIDKGLEIDK